MDAILMAGGSGSRLYPLTKGTNKHLLAVANKPMIYYSLSVLLLANVKRIFLVTNPDFGNRFESIISVLKSLGFEIKILIQEQAGGIAEGISLCENCISSDSFLLMLGDNFFYGPNLSEKLTAFVQSDSPCSILCYKIKNPSQLGVAKIVDGKVVEIREKPTEYIGEDAITGLYKLDEKAFSYIKKIKRSGRGELEITAVLNEYQKNNNVHYVTLSRGFTWFDMGTLDNLHKTQEFVRLIEKNQGYLIGCPEEALLKRGYIDRSTLHASLSNYPDCDYKRYLSDL